LEILQADLRGALHRLGTRMPTTQTTEINPLVRGFYDRVLEPVGFGQVAKRGYDILTR